MVLQTRITFFPILFNYSKISSVLCKIKLIVRDLLEIKFSFTYLDAVTPGKSDCEYKF